MPAFSLYAALCIMDKIEITDAVLMLGIGPACAGAAMLCGGRREDGKDE